MATQKEMRQYREDFIGTLTTIEFDGFEFVGITVDGPAYENAEGDVVVVKPIAKKEDFDVEDAIAEFDEKLEARLEREKARLEKAAAREAKAKAKLEELEKEEAGE